MFALLLAGVSLAACSRPPSARQAAEQFVRAVASGDVGAANAVAAERVDANDLVSIRERWFGSRKSFSAKAIVLHREIPTAIPSGRPATSSSSDAFSLSSVRGGPSGSSRSLRLIILEFRDGRWRVFSAS